MSRTCIRRQVVNSALAFLLLPAAVQACPPVTAKGHPVRITATTLSNRPTAPPPLEHGGKQEHCALAVGVLLGAALGSWSNPVIGLGVMRLGLHLFAMHCQ